MIFTFFTGLFTKVISTWVENRQAISNFRIRDAEAESSHRRKLEIQQQIAMLELDIEREKTSQAEISAIQSQIEAMHASMREIQETDRQLYSRANAFSLNLIVLMKPAITMIMLVILITVILNGMLTSNADRFDIIVERLESIGLFTFIEGVIGFWFGFSGASMIKK